jgi:hypothetical protein
MHFGTILLHFALIQQLIVFMEQQAPPGTRTGGERAGEAEGHAWEHHEGLRPIGLWEQHDPGAQVAEEANLVKMLEEREREARMAVRLFWLVMFFSFFSGHCCCHVHVLASYQGSAAQYSIYLLNGSAWSTMKLARHEHVGCARASPPAHRAKHDMTRLTGHG